MNYVVDSHEMQFRYSSGHKLAADVNNCSENQMFVKGEKVLKMNLLCIKSRLYELNIIICRYTPRKTRKGTGDNLNNYNLW